MVNTVAVGTDGSGTADKAVEFAIDLAARYEARIVFISAYNPVSESRLRREASEAPDDMQWMINPAEDVDATLRDCEERAEESAPRSAGCAGPARRARAIRPRCWSSWRRPTTPTCW
jgi:nucleotide-binding universal stress UspA family protein